MAALRDLRSSRIEAKANGFLESGLDGVKRIPFEKPLRVATTPRHDYINSCVGDHFNVIDMDDIRCAKISLGSDPLGGAATTGSLLPSATAWILQSLMTTHRSDLQPHDRRLGRQDPDGPLVTLRDEAAHRSEGPL